MRRRVLAGLAACAAAVTGLTAVPADAAPPSFAPIGRYATGLGIASGEIAQAEGKRLFVINTEDNSFDIVDISDPSAPTQLERVDLSPYGAGINSIAVKNGLVAVALEAATKTDPGKAAFFQTDGDFIGSLTLGALPDMVTFSPDGAVAVFANEGEPNDEYTVDPEGSVSVVFTAPFRLLVRSNIPGQSWFPGLTGNLIELAEHTVRFDEFNAGRRRNGELPAGIRIYGPNASVAQDIEPEYVTITDDSRTAYVTLQENNAIAEIDLRLPRVKAIRALGLKDLLLPANAIDASDEDGVNLSTWPVKGMYLPDAVSTFRVGNRQYVATANEGDTRDWDGFSEEERIKDLVLDPAVFPNAGDLQEDEQLGRLKVTSTSPQGPNGYTELWAFGARSFSIFEVDGKLVSDTGSDFERITADALPDFFNSDNEENNFDDRGDDKGPEPEGIATGVIAGRRYAFTALERVGGIMIYDITDPKKPVFVQYANTRDFTLAPDSPDNDSGPEAVQFIAANNSPTGKPLVIASHEISGTVVIYTVA